MCHTGQQQTEAAVNNLRAFGGQERNQTAQRPQDGRGGADGAGTKYLLKEIDCLDDLLSGERAKELPEINGDKTGDLLLPVFQLAHQIDSNLVALIDTQHRRDTEQRLPCVLAHGQMLAYG